MNNSNLIIYQTEDGLTKIQARLENRKKVLLKLLDLNQLYANHSSIEYEDFKCSDEEKAVTIDFYGST